MNKHPQIHPPVYFAIFFIAAIFVDRFLPLVRLGGVPWFGTLIALAGIISAVWANKLFHENKTTHIPFQKPSSLVVDGPYAYTRNPMYLGFTLVLLGEAVFLGSLSSFLAPLAMYFAVDTRIIPFEEKMLEETFKDKYQEYKKRVRRWL